MSLTEVMDELWKKKHTTEKDTSARRKTLISKTKTIADPRDTDPSGPASRVCRRQCLVCNTQWAFAMDGTEPRHQYDLECYRCTKSQ